MRSKSVSVMWSGLTWQIICATLITNIKPRASAERSILSTELRKHATEKKKWAVQIELKDSDMQNATGDETDHGKGQRKRGHFGKKTWWSFSEAESSAGEQKESNFLGRCLSYFLLLWYNTITKSNLWDKRVILAGHSRRIRVHHGTEAWQQVAGMAQGAGS